MRDWWDRMIAGAAARAHFAGPISLVEAPRKGVLIVLFTYAAASVNSTVLCLLLFAFDEPVAGLATVAYVVGITLTGFASFVTGSWTKMASYAWVIGFANHVVVTALLGGLNQSGGYLMFGVANTVLNTEGSRLQLARYSGAYVVATLVLVAADPFLRASRPAPESILLALLFAQVFVTILVILVAVMRRYSEVLAEERQRSEQLRVRVNELFHRYVAPAVADTLIADPARESLGGEEVEATVLFADLTGFTTFSERVSPSEAIALLNRSFGEAVPAVRDEGGTIVQFSGDALMAVFNAPLPQPDHAMHAARASLRLQRAVATLQLEPGTPRFRVGLTTGPVVVGNVGTAELHNYTAIGDTTNLAARLQTFAPPGSVVIGERTRELLGDLADVRPLGAQELKGKTSPVRCYELVSLREPAPMPG